MIGNHAQTARFMRFRCHGRRYSIASIPVAATPMTAAGAGPSSAIAMTSARNEPETRRPRNSIVRTSLPIARTSSSRTISIGLQSRASLVARTTTPGENQEQQVDA